MFFKKKYTLVFGGGGANGSYQIGVWKAFRELGLKFNAVIGNSVGTLNSALFIQNDYDKALELWESVTLDKIIAIPKELLKNGKIQITRENFHLLKNIQKNFLKNKGLDTSPLKNLIKKYVDEDKIRKTRIDFGIITYQLNELKPFEVFIEDIPKGKLYDYLLASASLPGFKSTEIDGKQFIDGGVYDNIPFSLAKRRGYKDIIVVDISGLGINRRPDIVGTNTIYIKNSIDLGTIIDFNPVIAKKYIKLGYLDTLKIFGKNRGVKYFYNFDKKFIDTLNEILFSETAVINYKKYLKESIKDYNKSKIRTIINDVLPKEYKNYKYEIISLAECAALSLNLERVNYYFFKDFINIIWNKYNELEKGVDKYSGQKNKYFFEQLSQKIKNINIAQEFKDFFKKASYEHEKTFEIIFGRDKKELHTKTLSNFFPNLLGAKIFIEVLKIYYNNRKAK